MWRRVLVWWDTRWFMRHWRVNRTFARQMAIVRRNARLAALSNARLAARHNASLAARTQSREGGGE